MKGEVEMYIKLMNSVKKNQQKTFIYSAQIKFIYNHTNKRGGYPWLVVTHGPGSLRGPGQQPGARARAGAGR